MISRFFFLGWLVFAVGMAQAAEVFPRDSQWRYIRGLAEASSPDLSAWRLPNFPETGWGTGPAPFYYGEALAGTALGDMRGGFTSLYLRKTFVVPDPNAVSELQFESLSDDGFIAWINGRQVVRYNMPEGEIPFNGTSLGALSEPIPWETTVVTNPRDFLVAGTNVIAVHAFNTSLSDSSDFVFNASLSMTADGAAPVVANTIPLARALVRALRTIEVQFSEPVKNVDAGDLLINGAPAATVRAFSPSQYVFEFPEPPTGTVQVSWVAGHGIVDLAPAANAFAGPGWTYEFDPNAPLPAIMISEFMADNDETLNDENGDSSDWIELHNPTAQPVDLGGWFLSNDPRNLALWRLPGISLPANGYLLVFASEKNRTNPAGRLHANFKLAKETGFLALADPRTNAVSVFEGYPEQQEDVSYGRERSNPNVTGFFVAATPGKANSASGAGFAPKVAFSRDGGTFRSPFELTLSTGSSNAVIRYTIGTNFPSETSPIYSGPIQITNTMQVRARAYEPGLLPGPPRSESFVMLASAVVNFTSDLPIVILHNYGRGSVPATGEQFVMMQVFEPKHGVASMTNAPDTSQRARFRLRGSSTQGIPKGSFALETWDEFGADQKIGLLGMPEESDWVFYAPNNFEPVLIHNPFMHGLSREIGRYSPRTRFVEVYLNTGGGAIVSANYNGIYVIEEKIKRGPDRVDIDGLEPEHLAAPEVTGGYMLKIDRPDPGDFPFNAAGQDLNFVDPKGAEIRLAARDAQEQYIIGYFNQFGAALNGASYRDPLNGYAKFIDIGSWIDHHVLNVLSYNVDALRLSTYLYKPRNGKIEFGPLWDFDRALGSTDGRDANPRTWYNSGGTDFFHYPWWNRLFQDPDFMQRWIDRWEELRRGSFALTNFNRHIDEHMAQVRRAQPREQARWGWAPRGGSYQAEVNMMKTYLKDRAEFIDGQFVRPPALSLAGGMVTNGTEVTLTIPAGTTVYYTLNGTDPRLPGGGLSGDARLYSGPIALQGNARVVARARNLQHTRGPVTPSPWSGVVAATYVTEMPALAITEIMYNPRPSGTYTNQDFEFIELRNTGSKALDLGGFSIAGGVQFVFPALSLAAGEHVVVVKNRAVFESRFGTAARIAGEFAGNLANDGDRVVLRGPLLEAIAEAAYEDDWQPITDGHGFSLVATGGSMSGKAAWRASAGIDGSPGAADGQPAAIAPVLVSEVLAHTDPPNVDAVELHNPGAVPASIGGWWLTDDFDKPKKYRIPAGAIIPAGGQAAFDESQFNQGSQAFSFSSKGDDVYLFSADPAGELTGYVHGFEFPASENAVSFGLHRTSDNRQVHPPQASLTLGAGNAGPRVSPVVLNEIMFEPPLAGTNDNALDEFIELRNASGQAVALHDPAHPENTWRLRGGVEFDFPPGLTLPAGGFLLIVNFDPANPVFASGFRTRMNVPAETPLAGPYQGKLDNEGERIRLLKPDAPQGSELPDAGFVPYVVLEEAGYGAAAPWPSGASRSGHSLQRVANSFADDPSSWRVAAATPGAATAGPAVTDADADGLPDDWEAAHGLSPASGAGPDGADGDPDGDGLSNLQEHIAGTQPKNGQSVLRIDSFSTDGTSRILSVDAAPNVAYTVQFRPELGAGQWQKLEDIAASSVGGRRTVRDVTAAGGARFYRVAAMRP